MSCEAIRSLLPAFVGSDLGLSQKESLQCAEHVATCPGCAERTESLRRTLQLLRRVGRSESPPAGFQASLHLRLAQEPPPRLPLSGRLWRWLESVGLDSAPRLGVATAGLGLIVLIAALPALRGPSVVGRGSHGAAGEEVAAAFQVPQQHVAVVRFDFVADVEVPDVEFEVTLPSELHFMDAGQPVPEQKLVWRGSLSSGSNPIPLAVRGSKPGRYRVTARARGAGISVRHDILLEVVRS
jgi:anti-sigma factor RsiW